VNFAHILLFGINLAFLLTKWVKLNINRKMNNSNSILIGEMHAPSQAEAVEAISVDRTTFAAWTLLLLSSAAFLTAINIAFF